MSRRSAPTDSIPEICLNNTIVNKNDEVKTIEPDETLSEIKEIPNATLYGNRNNLKKIKSFKNLRQSYKVSNQKSVFVTDMKNMLKHLDVVSNKMNLELLIEIMNIANAFFIYGQKVLREKSKMEAVYELMLPYFMDDQLILGTMLMSVKHKIIKSNVIKRLYRRTKNYFF